MTGRGGNPIGSGVVPGSGLEPDGIDGTVQACLSGNTRGASR